MEASEAFLQLFKILMPKAPEVSIGTVKDVNRELCTCTVEREAQPTLFNCRLNAVIDTLPSQVVSYPAVGSYVLCLSLVDKTDTVIIAMSQVDEVSIKTGTTTATVNADGVVINGGQLGGLVNIQQLVNWMSQVKADMTALQTALAAFPVNVAAATGSVVFTPQTPAPNMQALQDNKVKH